MTRRTKDNALICNEKMGKGRCRKLVATEGGEVVCKNGHAIPIWEAWETYLEGAATIDTKSFHHLWPGNDAMTAVLHRLATPEFLHAPRDSSGIDILDYEPWMASLIFRAESLDRRIAAALKEYREKKVREREPLLARYLDAAMAAGGRSMYIRVRERILRALAQWRFWGPTPEDYLARFDILREAAEYLDDPHAPLYRHNVEQAATALNEEGAYSPLFFLREYKDGDVLFTILLDPHWKDTCWRGEQMMVTYRKETGGIKWHINASRTAETMVRRAMKNQEKRYSAYDDKAKSAEWLFSSSESDHVYIYPPAGFERQGWDALGALGIVEKLRQEFPRDMRRFLRGDAA